MATRLAIPNNGNDEQVERGAGVVDSVAHNGAPLIWDASIDVDFVDALPAIRSSSKSTVYSFLVPKRAIASESSLTWRLARSIFRR